MLLPGTRSIQKKSIRPTHDRTSRLIRRKKHAGGLTVESDKASMEIPSNAAGILQKLLIQLGDKVSEGTPIAILQVQQVAKPAAEAASLAAPDTAAAALPAPQPQLVVPHQADPPAPPKQSLALAHPSEAPARPTQAPLAHQADAALMVLNKPHASPAVRKFARELGVDLTRVSGSGAKGRITQPDVQAYVKAALQQDQSQQTAKSTTPQSDGAALGLIAWPQVDFAKFGSVERKPLSRIKKISGANLHRNWVMIPHVTQHDEADVSDLEAFRQQLNQEHAKSGLKLTMLAFLMKAMTVCLKQFPEFNASLDGDELVLKHYMHIGFAADTANGLVVPVLRDADKKGVLNIARETAELAAKARDGKLSPSDMQGGSISISSLGGIGGSFFTPIINAPEVAILGVGRGQTKPQWDTSGSSFQPRLMLPLSLSYDHRVIDGAMAARFISHLGQLLSDFRRVTLS
ncbi:MAG: dihydrolipoyllysine-residue acetyltransferase [Betaproteobacteria bacterium]|nr:dihydrolipoyllysine-residue acetyltransferase [Betaproteobacteria bacterium]